MVAITVVQFGPKIKSPRAMEDTVGLDTVKRLGRGVAEAVMVSSFGRKVATNGC